MSLFHSISLEPSGIVAGIEDPAKVRQRHAALARHLMRHQRRLEAHYGWGGGSVLVRLLDVLLVLADLEEGEKSIRELGI